MSLVFHVCFRVEYLTFLIDSDLEWLTGGELCSIIKKYSKYNNIPILKLSDNEHVLMMISWEELRCLMA